MGQTGQELRRRIGEARSDMRIEKKRHSTRLSRYVWELKDRGVEHEIEWEIISRAREYVKGAKTCNLCGKEKLAILEQERRGLLNIKMNSSLNASIRENTNWKITGEKRLTTLWWQRKKER